MEKNNQQSIINSKLLTRLFFHSGLLIAGLITLCGCKANHEIEVMYHEDVEQTVTVQASVKATRTPSDSVETQIIIWSSGDAFCFFDNESTGATFRLVGGAGTKKGTFAGDGMHGMTKAIYPVSCKHLGLEDGYKELMLPMDGQIQIGNNNDNNMAPFSYMIGEVDEHAPTNMVFSMLVAKLKWELRLPEGCEGEVNKLEVLADSGEALFVKSLCPCNPKESIMSDQVSLKLLETELDESKKLTAYMMIAPVAFEQQDMTVRISMTHLGETYYYSASLGQLTVNMQAGHTYEIQKNLNGNS